MELGRLSDLDGPVTIYGFTDLDLGRNALFENVDVGDDADGSVREAEVFEGGEGDIEGVGVEGAKALVNEEAFDAGIAACEVGETEGEGEADEKGFTTGEASSGANSVGLIAIDDLKAEIVLVGSFDLVALIDFGKVGICALEELGKRETLGEFGEFVALGGADEGVEFNPRLGRLFELLNFFDLSGLRGASPFILIDEKLNFAPSFIGISDGSFELFPIGLEGSGLIGSGDFLGFEFFELFQDLIEAPLKLVFPSG